jgi:hypothetical protein
MTTPSDTEVSKGQLTLAAAVSGTTLDVTLTNNGSTEVVVNSSVLAGAERHYDWFWVELEVAAVTRELRFQDDRNRSAIERKTLAPGASLTHTLDLAAWARRARNSAKPLPSGRGTLRAFYEVTGDREAWNGRLAASPVKVEFP